MTNTTKAEKTLVQDVSLTTFQSRRDSMIFHYVFVLTFCTFLHSNRLCLFSGRYNGLATPTHRFRPLGTRGSD